ncbi:hypothetical protein HELRODRAFT_158774 [Helobdella robusta]|uniref:Uncharacterized protein n=1 Tax=Helobdella robusta TaxID=6412 RepID=T1EN89_HELRO|nr:hypothetical protein HELRODRAFT_158774 [Helobdella robusta]ESO12290.1 hypothetical protein HELRODRAFT_158774 [Helobdella robusta]
MDLIANAQLALYISILTEYVPIISVFRLFPASLPHWLDEMNQVNFSQEQPNSSNNANCNGSSNGAYNNVHLSQNYNFNTNHHASSYDQSGENKDEHNQNKSNNASATKNKKNVVSNRSNKKKNKLTKLLSVHEPKKPTELELKIVECKMNSAKLMSEREKIIQMMQDKMIQYNKCEQGEISKQLVGILMEDVSTVQPSVEEVCSFEFFKDYSYISLFTRFH